MRLDEAGRRARRRMMMRSPCTQSRGVLMIVPGMHLARRMSEEPSSRRGVPSDGDMLATRYYHFPCFPRKRSTVGTPSTGICIPDVIDVDVVHRRCLREER